MVTPTIPRPGKVPPLAQWVEWRIPTEMTLPTWVPRSEFLTWLEPHIEQYATRRMGEALSAETQRQNSIGEAWLQRALRELERSDVSSLETTPRNRMPGKTHAACWHEAYKRGLDWEGLVAMRDLPALLECVTGAIALLKREKKPSRRGRKSLRARDHLLKAVVEKLLLFTVTSWDEGQARTITRAPFLSEARDVAEAVLIACGAPSVSLEQNDDSVARAMRRASRT